MIQEYEDKSTLLILFEAIKAEILAKVPEITEVVIYSGQEESEQTQRPFAYPYVSVQMAIDWEPNEARGTNYDDPPITGAIGLQSKGVATIIVHVLFANREDDTDGFMTNEPIRHSVHRAIHLLTSADGFFTALMKTRDDLPTTFDASQDYPTTYICNVKEGALVIGTEDTIDEFGSNDLTIP